jgi:monothiol glutaredoxin
VKTYTSWPTLPQIFIGGEFVGGSDILREMHESGELGAKIAALASAAAG